MIDDELLETEAVALVRLAGLDPELRNCPIDLALRLGLPVRDAGATTMPGDGFAVVSDESASIYIRAAAPRARRDFVTAHEVAEVILARAGYNEPDREDVANRFGAAILLPRPCVTRALRTRPWAGVREFAARLKVSDGCASLRIGESTGDPLALVDGRSVRLRGAPWPLSERPEHLARCRDLPTGAYRWRLGPQRFVVGVA